MRTLLLSIASLLFVTHVSFASSYVMEAENGVLSGVSIFKDTSGYSGTGYVGTFATVGSKVEIIVNVDSSGIYQLDIGYFQPWSLKKEKIYVNGILKGQLDFPISKGFETIPFGRVLLNKGKNTIAIEADWTWIYIDNIILTKITVPEIDYKKATSILIDPDANNKTQELFNRLKSTYGQKIISGQHKTTNQIFNHTNQFPIIRGFGIQNYTKGYAYNWDNTNGYHDFGWKETGKTQEIIDWYNNESCGIVTIEWHWHVPNGIGASPGMNTFLTKNTTFDLSEVIDPQHPDHQYLLEDIDSIATQLKKLETAGVPILWRPLHEAEGGWFWWGAKGPEPCLKLYDLMYDRLTNYHNLHNLIWIWSGYAEEDWYPGNNKVDIYGYDSYPGNFVHNSQKIVFDKFYKICHGEKMIAMTENGPLPDVNAMISDDAMWSFFMSWDENPTANSLSQHVIDTYDNKDVLKLSNTDCYLITDVFVPKKNKLVGYPNPTKGIVNLSVNIDQLEIYDINGILLEIKTNTDFIDLSTYDNGFYIIKLGNHRMKVFKR